MTERDIKLFVKLPGWFQIDTPLGTYNPDWAILKDDGHAFYLVRETKGTRDFPQAADQRSGQGPLWPGSLR
jgi:restriction endonuclease